MTQLEASLAPPDADTGALALRWDRLLALSGVVFAPFFLLGWFASAGETPHYTAANQDWVKWAHDSQWKGRISSFAILLAAFVFLSFIATIRNVLGRAESSLGSSVQLARVASAGALTGIVGITIAIVTLGAASTEGTDADPVVSRAVTTASAGAFLVAAMGFAALLMAAGVLTLRSGVLARWTGIVALTGAISFLITSLTVLDGTSDGSVFGYGFFPGVVALVTWTAATSVARYRALGTQIG